MHSHFPKGVHLQQLLFNHFIKSCCDYVKSLLWHRLYQAVRLPILPEFCPLVSQRSGSDFQVGSQRCRCLISSLSIAIVDEHVVLQITLISDFIFPHLIQAFFAAVKHPAKLFKKMKLEVSREGGTAYGFKYWERTTILPIFMIS